MLQNFAILGCVSIAKYCIFLAFYISCTVSELNHTNTLAALMSSSARHSAIVLMFLNAASRAPVHNSQIAYNKTHSQVHGLADRSVTDPID